MIAPTEEPKLEDTTLEPKENDTPQPATHTVPTLAGYTTLQKLKIEGFLEQQFVIILIDAGSIHNFMSILGVVKVMEIGYDSCVLRLEGCPKDDLVGGNKIGRVLVGCKKKSDKRYSSRIFRRKILAGQM
ncbi:hypothetical protein B296_00024972 [Ensete ventricosum]|uniref:Uncharacterized protein n=1 Tax=Ensete ventricosum TaxID=4639 RepID=A0A426X1M6_ENSVE|nr:hypothetical protein B296_00024972 [Ensete ventricosum]